MAERVYFERGIVRVTHALFQVGDETYPLRQITSVMVAKTEPDTQIAVLLLVLAAGGVVVSVGGTVAAVWYCVKHGTPGITEVLLGGAAVASVCALLVKLLWRTIRRAKATYHVRITTAAGERALLRSTDATGPREVVAALKQAISDRM